MTAAAICQEWTNSPNSSGFGGPCGRKAKGEYEGRPMCGPHLGGARRSAFVRAERAEEYAASQVVRQRLIDLCARLGVGRPYQTDFPRSWVVALTEAEATNLLMRAAPVEERRDA